MIRKTRTCLAQSCVTLVLFSGCTNTINNLPDTAESAPDSVHLIVSHQIISKASLNPGLSLVATIGAYAVGGPAGGGIVLDIVGQNLLAKIGEETNVTMLDKLNMETQRQLACSFMERGYDVSSGGFLNRQAGAYSELATNADFYAHMQSTYERSRESLFPDGKGTVVLAEYYMMLHDKSIGDYLSDLRFDEASLHMIAVSKNAPDDEELLYRQIGYAPRHYTRYSTLQLFRNLISLGRWPQREEIYASDCGNRSLFHSLAKGELTPESTIEDMQAFLSRLNIDHNLQRKSRILSGKYEPEGDLDTVDEKVHVRLHYDGDTETFSGAEAYYEYKRPQR